MSEFTTTPGLTLLPAVDVADGKAVRLTQGEAGTETELRRPRRRRRRLGRPGRRVDPPRRPRRRVRPRRQPLASSRRSSARSRASTSSCRGGIRDDRSLETRSRRGAKRINLGTAALENPEWAANVIAEYGEAVAVGLDVRGTTLAARGWTEEGGDLWEVLDRLEDAGCARYVVTDVTKDGTLQGPNLDLLRQVMERTDRPVVASGGISSLDDIAALRELVPLGLEGAIVGKALYAGAFTLAEALDVAAD